LREGFNFVKGSPVVFHKDKLYELILLRSHRTLQWCSSHAVLVCCLDNL
jgi:hypothetical protein